MVMRLVEKLEEFIISETRPCHAPLRYPCPHCGEAFPVPEALASHVAYKHRGAKLPFEASQAIVEHWAVLFPRCYVMKRYARTDC